MQYSSFYSYFLLKTLEFSALSFVAFTSGTLSSYFSFLKAFQMARWFAVKEHSNLNHVDYELLT